MHLYSNRRCLPKGSTVSQKCRVLDESTVLIDVQYIRTHGQAYLNFENKAISRRETWETVRISYGYSVELVTVCTTSGKLDLGHVSQSNVDRRVVCLE